MEKSVWVQVPFFTPPCGIPFGYAAFFYRVNYTIKCNRKKKKGVHTDLW